MKRASPDLIRGQVTLPGPLVDAARDGTLVIFAGAGVSQNAPACYHNFDKLVKALTVDAVEQRPFDEEREVYTEAPDAYLGRVEQWRGQFGELARRYFLENVRETTPVHEALVRLYPTDDSVRIVTTNYDELFELVGRDVPVYSAPALPRGNDLHGIVHIHGRAEDPTSRLVITDRDFGEAYLSEGWAKDFIVELYRTHPVLFVGYSHSDLVMSYLARGIGSGPHPKYALVEEGTGATDWKALGIERIEYPNDTGDHSALRESLQGWADYARQSEVEHERSLQRYLAEAPEELEKDDQEAKEKASEVRRAIAHPGRIRYFTRHARGIAWVRWAEREGFLKALVGGGNEVGVDAWELVVWVTRQAEILTDPELRALLTKMGGEVSRDFELRIAHAVSRTDAAIDEVQLWSPVLFRPPVNPDHLLRLLDKSIQLDAPDIALAVLSVLLRTHVSLQRDFLTALIGRNRGEPAREMDRIEVATLVEDPSQLSDAYQAARWLLQRDDPRLARRLAMIAATSLAHGHELYRMAGIDWGSGDDPLVYGVGELGPFGQDYDVPDHGVELLIRLAITSHNSIHNGDPHEARLLREQWVRSDYPVLVLIALHLESELGDADRVLALLTSRPEMLLWVTTGADAERAVSEHFGAASEDGQERLRESLRALLAKEECPNAHRVRGAAQAAGLDLPEPKHDGTQQGRLGTSEGEGRIVLEDIVGQAPHEIVDTIERELKLFGDDEHDGTAPQGGFAREVADYVGGHPDWALTVAEYLAEAERWDSPVWRAIIWGTSNAPGEVEPSLRLLMRLAEWPLESAEAEQTGLVRKLFWQGGDDGAVRTGTSVLDRVFSEQGSGVLGEQEDAVGAVEALESLAGFVKKAEIELDLSSLFVHLLRSVEQSEVAREAVGKRMERLYELNSEWVRDHLVPLFATVEGGDPKVAEGLVRGVLSEEVRFLPVEIAIPLAKYLATVGLDLGDAPKVRALFPPESECERAASELPILKRRIAGVMARAVLLSNEDPYKEWLGPWLDRTEPVLRSHWAALLVREWRRDPSAVGRMWPVWMKAYLERRVSGFPLALHACEVRWLFDWVASVPQEDFDEAVSLLEHAPPSAPPDRWFIRPLSDSGLLDTNPGASARLIVLALESGASIINVRDAAKIIARPGPPSWPRLVDALLLSGVATAEDIDRWVEPSVTDENDGGDPA